ncbi:MAG: nickel insertion protein, partial [Pyrinomonadaceae bacterium]
KRGINSQTLKINEIQNEKLTLIETNIDDLSPQILGYVMERAFASGALDCWFTHIQMKKNRPAIQLSILCKRGDRENLVEMIYNETTTIGVRIGEVERNCLARENIEIETEYGSVIVKTSVFNEKIINAKPEYEQIREIAVKSKRPMREIEDEVNAKFREKIVK